MNELPDSFQFDLVSPEKVLVSEPADMVIIPGSEGDFGVLPGHAPFLSSLRPGVIEVRTKEGEPRKIFVAGGFADVSETNCTVLAEDSISVTDLDKEKIEKQVADLSEDIDLATDEKDRERARQRLLVAKAKLSAITGELVV